MQYLAGLTLISAALVAAGAAGVCAAQAGLSPERSGLGLKPQSGTRAAVVDVAYGTDSLPSLQARRTSEFTLYGGAREAFRFGWGPAETYSGIAYVLRPGWDSSFEAGYTQDSLFAPRRYALTGQVRTALSEGRSLSLGIKYRAYDPDVAMRYTAGGEVPFTNGYTLAPTRLPGPGLAPEYQLQFGYQHSAASSFGLALGREVETLTPTLDPTGVVPRQLTFTGQHWLTPSWALSYDVLSGDLASPIRIQSLGLRVGVRYRF
jgi:YaiO family outer membrane protein